MPDYRVTWEIDLVAPSPEAAAREALRIQRDPESIATVFTVHGPNLQTVVVDLAELDAQTPEPHALRPTLPRVWRACPRYPRGPCPAEVLELGRPQGRAPPGVRHHGRRRELTTVNCLTLRSTPDPVPSTVSKGQTMNPKTPGLRFGFASALMGTLIAMSPARALTTALAPVKSTRRRPHWAPNPPSPQTLADIAAHNKAVALARSKRKRAQDARFELRLSIGDPVNNSKRRAVRALTT